MEIKVTKLQMNLNLTKVLKIVAVLIQDLQMIKVTAKVEDAEEQSVFAILVSQVLGSEI